ncbi:MAG: DUF624 domain-containing protein [Ruminococcaceae bacterium]|nr:DUF624 domain-containing protein [Oscillospiraceae bacterium]
MRRLLSEDSAIMRFFTAVTNMMLINILWLICVIPVITAGAATTAAYYALYQNLTNEDSAVVKPFFRAFRQNFKQATLLWIPLMLIGLLLGLDAVYLVGNHPGQFHVLWVAFFVIALLYAIVVSHAFAIMGRYDAPTGQIVRNCFLIFFMNLFRSVLIMVLTVLPILILLFLPQQVVRTLPLWILLIFGLLFFANAHMFLQSFRKSDAAYREQTAECAPQDAYDA